MGDSISEGTIESFVKNVGEYVEADEVIARIETDKVTVDILAAHSGVITQYFAEEGDTVEVGVDFLEIDENAKGEAKAAPKQAEPEAAPKKEEAAPAKKVINDNEKYFCLMMMLYLGSSHSCSCP